MTYLIIYAVSIVPMMLATAYVFGRCGEARSAGWSAALIGFTWPLAIPFGAVFWATEWIALLGEKHAAQRQQNTQKR